jgi:hypothetical protein
MKHSIDSLYESWGAEIPLVSRIKNTAHLFFCPECAEEARKLKAAKSVLRDFSPDAPDFAEAVMERIEKIEKIEKIRGVHLHYPPAHRTEVSFRGWIIAGLLMFFSFITVFFNIDFENIARKEGVSFLIPVGLTIGLALTGYGAVFIASHLEELSERFGLR